MRYRYSRWNGEDEVRPEADELLDRFADDLLAGTDLGELLHRMAREGLPEHGIAGLDQLRAQLADERQDDLTRFDLDSLLRGIEEELAAIAASEQAARQGRPLPPSPEPALEPQRAEPSAGECAEATGASVVTQESDSCGTGGATGGSGTAGQGGAPSRNGSKGNGEVHDGDVKAGNQLARGGTRTSGAGKAGGSMRRLLAGLNSRGRTQLGGLPAETAARFAAFAAHDFAGPEAEERFRALLDSLAAQIEHHYLPQTPSSIHPAEGMNGEAAWSEQMKQPLARQAALMQRLLASLSEEVRQQVEQVVEAVMRSEIPDLLAALTLDPPPRPVLPPRPFHFTGSEPVDLGQALGLMDRLDRLERFRRFLQEGTLGQLLDSPTEELAHLLGQEAGQRMELLRELLTSLERAGYARRTGSQVTLTARGIRRLGDRAARTIFSRLQAGQAGRHSVPRAGRGPESTDQCKRYEFGDALRLDVEGTVRHALTNHGSPPLRLHPDDFVVFRPEAETGVATVIMLDLSRSMLAHGFFASARLMTLALRSLIQERFPRDTLCLLGFSDRARELPADALPEITWHDRATNMQAGFQLARHILARYRAANRQIVLVTDGEPTAHSDGDRVEFSYPPSARTIDATLLEVRHCTHERILINTFMLERGGGRVPFVEQMARLNRGRAFFVEPERLGEFVLADYVRQR